MSGRPVHLLTAAALVAVVSSATAASASCYSCGSSYRYAAPVVYYTAPVVYSYSYAAPVTLRVAVRQPVRRLRLRRCSADLCRQPGPDLFGAGDHRRGAHAVLRLRLSPRVSVLRGRRRRALASPPLASPPRPWPSSWLGPSSQPALRHRGPRSSSRLPRASSDRRTGRHLARPALSHRPDRSEALGRRDPAAPLERRGASASHVRHPHRMGGGQMHIMRQPGSVHPRPQGGGMKKMP